MKSICLFPLLIYGVNSFVSPVHLTTRSSLHVKPLESSSSDNNNNNNNNNGDSTTTLLVNFENSATETTAAAAETKSGSTVVEGLTIDDVQIDRIDYGGYSLNGYSGTSFYKNSLSSAYEAKPGLLSRTVAYDLEEFNEDGYGDMRRKMSRRSIMDNIVKFPFRVLRRMTNGPKITEPGNLILVRHGESVWNANKTFTGWSDPDLSADGVREVEHAARLLLEGGWEIDLVFTSRLKRAIRSAWVILQELNEVYLPVFKSWRLNERYSCAGCAFFAGPPGLVMAELLKGSHIFIVRCNNSGCMVH